jgi:hypothetical protein
MNELRYCWGQLQAIFEKVKHGFSFAVAAVRWATRRVKQVTHDSGVARNDTAFRLGELQGMSLKSEIHLFQAGITELTSLVKLPLSKLCASSTPLPSISPELRRLTALPQTSLFDWVDQAILLCALSSLEVADNDRDQLLRLRLYALRAIGVRTATDFIDAATDKPRMFRAVTANQDFVAGELAGEGSDSRTAPTAFDSETQLTGLEQALTKDQDWKCNLDEIGDWLATQQG